MKKQTIKIKSGESAVPLSRVVTLPETAKGVYTNFAVIKHTSKEFIVDFILHIEEDAQLVARVIMSPSQVRSFLNALKTNVERYEMNFGQGEKDQEADKAVENKKATKAS